MILLKFIVGALLLAGLIVLALLWLRFTFDRGWFAAWLIGAVFIIAIYIGACFQFGIVDWLDV